MTNHIQLTGFMTIVYRVILATMILALLVAGVAAVIDGSGNSRVAAIMIEIYLLAIPASLLVFAVYAIARRTYGLGSLSLLLFALWGVFKLIG